MSAIHLDHVSNQVKQSLQTKHPRLWTHVKLYDSRFTTLKIPRNKVNYSYGIYVISEILKIDFNSNWELNTLEKAKDNTIHTFPSSTSLPVLNIGDALYYINSNRFLNSINKDTGYLNPQSCKNYTLFSSKLHGNYTLFHSKVYSLGAIRLTKGLWEVMQYDSNSKQWSTLLKKQTHYSLTVRNEIPLVSIDNCLYVFGVNSKEHNNRISCINLEERSIALLNLSLPKTYSRIKLTIAEEIIIGIAYDNTC